VIFNAATGRVAKETQLYGVGHRITQEWGAAPVTNPGSCEGGYAATEILLHPVLRGFYLECVL